MADAELRAKFIVVGQSAASDAQGSKLRLIRSTNAGNSFRDPINVRSGTRQQSVTVCGDGTPVAVYGRHSSSDGWTIEQSIRTGGDTWSRRTLSNGSESPRHPESACAANPTVVWSAWLTKVGGNYQVKVVRAAQTDVGLPKSIIFGSAGTTRTGPVLTLLTGGSGVAVAWQGPNGNIQTSNVTLVGSNLVATIPFNIGLGAAGQPATNPQAGSFNSRIVIAWTQCADVFARVSTNDGTSYAGAKKLANYACPGEIGGVPNSAAVRTKNIAVGYDLFKPSGDTERIVTTKNNFANRQNNQITSGKAGFLVGYVVVPGGDIRLGVVYEQGSNIRFRRCSQTVCGSF
jgi:hypothetical protein